MPAPSITSARQFLDHVLESKGLEVPELPRTCVITYREGLLERALDGRASASVDIGATVPTTIHLVRPESKSSYGIVAGRPGAPMAAVLLEELIALGFEQFLVFGTAGCPASGDDAVPFGHLVVPDRSYVYEGTSGHYGQEAEFVRTDGRLRWTVASRLREAGVVFAEGPAASTDALYRETPEFIAQLLARGVRAVEMELSALLSVARFHGRALAAVFCISDIIDLRGEWRVGMTSRQLRDVEAIVLPVLESAAG